MRAGFDSNHDYEISGPEQARSHDFSRELRNDKFKEALVNFPISHWQSNDVVPVLGTKTIVFNFFHCNSYSVDNCANMVQTENLELFCPSHEETDTKILCHVSKINKNSNVLIKCAVVLCGLKVRGDLVLLQNL